MRVNSIDADPGCVVDGDVHGQYSADRLADIAIAYGLALDPDNDPRHWRALLNESTHTGDTSMNTYHHEHLDDAADALLDSLNAVTEGGWFEWDDGSVFLVEDTDDEEDDEDEEEYDDVDDEES